MSQTVRSRASAHTFHRGGNITTSTYFTKKLMTLYLLLVSVQLSKSFHLKPIPGLLPGGHVPYLSFHHGKCSINTRKLSSSSLKVFSYCVLDEISPNNFFNYFSPSPFPSPLFSSHLQICISTLWHSNYKIQLHAIHSTFRADDQPQVQNRLEPEPPKPIS